MRKIILIALSGLIFLSGPLSAQKTYHINGAVGDSLNGQLVIFTIHRPYGQEMLSDNTITDSPLPFETFGQKIFVDTASVQNGMFSFESNEYSDHLASIVIKKQYEKEILPAVKLLLEPGIISISYPGGRPHVVGTSLNEIYTTYLDSMNWYYSETKRLRQSEMGIEASTELIIPYGSELEKLYCDVGEYMINFSRQNYSNPFGKDLFMLLLDIGTRPNTLNIQTHIYLSRNQKTVDEIFDFIEPEIRDSPSFHSYVKRIEKSKQPSPLIGKKIESFSLSTPSGAAKQLSDYIGKKDYVFLEFWASWCGPCIASIPELKKIYAEHSDRLEIVSISLDTSETAWIDAMKAQNMPWPQLVDLNAFDSGIAKWFGIKGIPFGVLVDKDGVIVDLSGAAGLKLFMQSK